METARFRPLKGALVRLLPELPASTALIVIQAPDPSREAIIEALAPDIRDLNVGDRVLCRPAQGVEVGDLLLIPDTGLVARLTE